MAIMSHVALSGIQNLMTSAVRSGSDEGWIMDAAKS
jgi:hypothetical protein